MKILLYQLLYYTHILCIPILNISNNELYNKNTDNSIIQGDFYFYNTKNCTIRKCSGNNMDTPYGILTFPSRYYRDNYDNVCFDLNHNDYIEIDLITPYESTYYSFGIYLLDYKNNTNTIIKTSASLNDTLTNYFINQRMKQNWYERPIKIYLTSNEIISDYLKKFDNNLNSFIYTFNYKNYDPTQMRLSFFMRIINCKNKLKLQKYIENSPVIALRKLISHLSILKYKNFQYDGSWKKRSKDGVFEYNYIKDIKYLYDDITKYTSNLIFDVMNTRSHLWNINYDNGWDCIKNNLPCWIDNRDTVYLWSGCLDPTHSKKQGVRGFYFDENQIILVVGVNHTYYNNSIYHSSQLYDRTVEQSIFSFTNIKTDNTNQSKSYENSCNILFRKNEYINKYYCVMYSRENIDYWKDIIHIPNEYRKFYIQISDELPYGIPKNHLSVIVERVYLQSENTISPSYTQLIWPKVYSIHRKLRCV